MLSTQRLSQATWKRNTSVGGKEMAKGLLGDAEVRERVETWKKLSLTENKIIYKVTKKRNVK